MRPEFESIEKVIVHAKAGRSFVGAIFQGLDLRPCAELLRDADLDECVLLGCIVPESLALRLAAGRALFFPQPRNIPFSVYRGHLYTPDELLGDYQPGVSGSYGETLDGRCYQHYRETGGEHTKDAFTALCRRLHDHGMTDALHEFIDGRDVVAIMGGHSLKRSHPGYLQVANLARDLARRGYLVTTGGGPGAMEASHLGVWFATRRLDELHVAVEMLSRAPLYTPIEQWLDAAWAVRERFPYDDDPRCVSLGIPTWLYGHEPPTCFASDIAKYFANSVREEGLLAIATSGVVFTPGSAGTIQEIFQDATQNHYNSFGVVSPMIFLGEDYWRSTKPVFPLLANLAAGHDYSSLLSITDEIPIVIERLDRFRAMS